MFGTEQFYIYSNNNLDYNLETKFRFPPAPPPLSLKKVKLFIYGALLIPYMGSHSAFDPIQQAEKVVP